MSSFDPIEQLAINLFSITEKLDPSEEYDFDLPLIENWYRLDNHRRSFYLNCIKKLFSEKELVLSSLEFLGK